MPALPYSHKSVAAVPLPEPPRRTQEWGVQGQTGLLLVVTNTGSRGWYLRYQLNGRRRKMHLGNWPEMGLADAADAATVARDNLKRGEDPQGAPREDGEGTTGELFGVYIRALEREVERGSKSARTLEERRRILALKELDNLRAIPPAEVTARDIARCVDAFEERGAFVMMNRVQVTLGGVFGWAVDRFRYGLEANPVAGLKRRHEEHSRERTLDYPKNDEPNRNEVREVWAYLEARPSLAHSALKIILATGQRPGEVRRMEWAHVDLERRVWAMPEGYRKRTRADKGRPARAHRVPLSDLVEEELECIKEKAQGGYMFPARTQDGWEPLSRHTLARVATRCWRRLGMARFTPHDLRRTCRTGLADLGVDYGVGEKVVGHVLPKVQRTYDTSEQWEQRVEALDLWAAHLRDLVRR